MPTVQTSCLHRLRYTLEARDCSTQCAAPRRGRESESNEIWGCDATSWWRGLVAATAAPGHLEWSYRYGIGGWCIVSVQGPIGVLCPLFGTSLTQHLQQALTRKEKDFACRDSQIGVADGKVASWGGGIGPRSCPSLAASTVWLGWADRYR